MKTRFFNIFILLIFLGGSFNSFPSPLPLSSENLMAQQELPFSPGIQVLRTDASGLTLALDAPTYQLDSTTLSEKVYDALTLPNSELWGKPGYPQLPIMSGLIGIPPNAEVTMRISMADSTLVDGYYTLSAGPHPLPLENDLEAGKLGYDPDMTVYSQDQWFPDTPVVLSEDAWLRDQRVMRITFFPFQYNPVQRTLRWYSHLEVEISFIGDVSPSPVRESAFEDTFASTLLNYETALSWRVPTAQTPMPDVPDTFLGPRFDMTVNQDGIYHVTYADLQTAGMDVDNVDPTTFYMHNQGEEVAIYVFGEEDNSFDPGDYLAFYGEKFRGALLAERYASMMDPGNGQPGNNWFWLCASEACDLAGAFEQYTDDNIYSLTEGGTPGPRMGTVNGTPLDGPLATVYTTTVRAEQSNYWWSYEFESEDVWFWSRIQPPSSSLPFTTTFPVELTAVAPGYEATLHAEVASFNFTSGYPDHHTQIRLNAGTPVVDDAYWDGRARYAFTAQVSPNSVVNGTNNLLLTLLPDVSPGSVYMFFDFFEITYARLFVASADQLKFTRYAPGTWKYEITGFDSPSVEVYDLTNPFLPVRVLNPIISGNGPYTTSFQRTDGVTASYYTVGGNSYLTPDTILQYQPPNFASMPEADYLFITHEDFIPSLQPLAAYYTAQGLSVAIVDVDDLYREFNDGIYHPIAIKNFLAFTFANWQTPPTYVTLVGSGHWNFKNYGAPTMPYINPPPVYMPPNLAYIDPWQGQTDATNLLATIIGDDTLPDLHIARVPVSSSTEMDAFVQKTLAYQTQPVQEWQRNHMFVADNIPDPAGDFIASAEAVISSYLEGDPYYQPIRIYENDFGCTTSNSPPCNAVTYAITNTLNITGSLLVNYFGHGSFNRWSNEQIFINADVGTLDNPTQLPIILSMTCLDGYWLYPNNDSLARTLLIAADKGAVATFSPTGLGVATGHDLLTRGFYEALFTQGRWELGAATLQAKVKLFLADHSYDLMHTFTVFGDPALHIPTPYDVELTPEVDSRSASPGQTVTYTLDISNPGLVTDTYTITLAGNAWDTSLSHPILGPIAPGGTSTFTLTVDIPPEALGNQTDTMIVRATSQQAIAQTDTSTLSTTALTEGLELSPLALSGFGTPDSLVTYTFTVTNTSIVTDVFTLTLSGNSWPSNLSTPSLPVAPGASQDFQVVVQIPSTALGYDLDHATVLAQSSNDPAHAAVATLSTQALTEAFVLSPAKASQIGLAGSTVTYVLEISNLLNISKYYTVALTGQQWETQAPITVGPANPGETVNFLVSVTVPLSATTGLTDTVNVNVSMLDMQDTQGFSVLTTQAEALPPPPPDIFYIFLPVAVRP